MHPVGYHVADQHRLALLVRAIIGMRRTQWPASERRASDADACVGAIDRKDRRARCGE